MKITGNGRARLQSCPPVLTGPRRFVFSQRQPSRNQTICLAFSLRPSRLSGEKALSGINREDAKSAKNPRRRILSKRQRICTLVVQMDTDVAPIHLCESLFICGSPRRYEVL